MQIDKEGDLGNSVYICIQSTQVEGDGFFWCGFFLLLLLVGWLIGFGGFFWGVDGQLGVRVG